VAENLKYNLKDQLLSADETMKGSLSLLGMTMLTQPAYNNSMRSVMFTSHLNQFVNLLESDFPGFFTNGENVVGRHSTAYKKAKHNLTVFRKVEKFGDIIDDPFVYTLFIFDEKKQEYDIITRKDSENLVEVFGYDYDNDMIDSLSEGDFVSKGTVLYKSKSYDESMNYRYGKQVPMMYTTDPYTSEDACVPAQSLAEEMASIEINTVSIGVNQNDFLLDLYGDEDGYKPLPDIGKWSHGEVAAKRTLFSDQLLSDFKDNSLNRIMDSDVCYYKTGQVVDIDIYCNNPDLEDNPFNEQIIKYLNSQNKYYEEIKETCEEIIASGYKYTHAIDYLYKRADEFLDPEKKWKDNDSLFGNLLIDITLKNSIPLQVGQKLTGRYGNKSVISEIRPDDEMPFYYDDNGNKVVVKLLFNVLAIINRTTAFPIYELTINFICNKVRCQMSKSASMKQKENLLFGIVNDFNEKQAREMKKVYDELLPEEKEDYIESCINDRIFIHQAPMWETKPIFFRLLEIYDKYDFLNPYDIYINKWGRTIKLLNPGFVGEMYIIKLKQSARKGFSARGMGSINGKGLPERSYKNKSFTELRSSTPIRFGEFESLNFSIGIIPEDIQLFHLMYRSSTKGRRELAEQLISPNDEFEISPTYTSRVAEIFAVVLKSLGLRLDFVDEDEELREYDDSYISNHELDGETYLCTEYQFMLVQRRKDIEKELLKKYGVIDKDELNKLTMVELINRNFVVGPDKSEYETTPGLQPDK
jgi:hypothetical protein